MDSKDPSAAVERGPSGLPHANSPIDADPRTSPPAHDGRKHSKDDPHAAVGGDETSLARYTEEWQSLDEVSAAISTGYALWCFVLFISVMCMFVWVPLRACVMVPGDYDSGMWTFQDAGGSLPSSQFPNATYTTVGTSHYDEYVFLHDHHLENGAYLYVCLLVDIMLWVDWVLRVKWYARQRHIWSRVLSKSSETGLLTSYMAFNTDMDGLIVEKHHRGWFNMTIFWFVFDFIATFPLCWIAIIAGSKWFSLFRMTIVLRLFTSTRYLPPVYRWLWRQKCCRKESRTTQAYIDAGLARMLKLFACMVLMAHLHGCIFYFLAAIESTLHYIAGTWAENDGLISENTAGYTPLGAVFSVLSTRVQFFPQFVPTVSRFHAYIRAVYWAVITMVTTGLGDIVPLTGVETAFCLYVQFAGMLLTTAVIGQVSNLLVNSDSAEGKFQTQMDLLNRYMEYRDLPRSLRQEILQYHLYRWQRYHGRDLDGMFSKALPSSLVSEIRQLRTVVYLKKVPEFQGLDHSFLMAMCEYLQVSVYVPNGVIVRAGTISDKFGLLSDGLCDMVRLRMLTPEQERRINHQSEKSVLSAVADEFSTSRAWDPDSETSMISAFEGSQNSRNHGGSGNASSDKKASEEARLYVKLVRAMKAGDIFNPYHVVIPHRVPISIRARTYAQIYSLTSAQFYALAQRMKVPRNVLFKLQRDTRRRIRHGYNGGDVPQGHFGNFNRTNSTNMNNRVVRAESGSDVEWSEHTNASTTANNRGGGWGMTDNSDPASQPHGSWDTNEPSLSRVSMGAHNSREEDIFGGRSPDQGRESSTNSTGGGFTSGWQRSQTNEDDLHKTHNTGALGGVGTPQMRSGGGAPRRVATMSAFGGAKPNTRAPYRPNDESYHFLQYTQRHFDEDVLEQSDSRLIPGQTTTNKQSNNTLGRAVSGDIAHVNTGGNLGGFGRTSTLQFSRRADSHGQFAFATPQPSSRSLASAGAQPFRSPFTDSETARSDSGGGGAGAGGRAEALVPAQSLSPVGTMSKSLQAQLSLETPVLALQSPTQSSSDTHGMRGDHNNNNDDGKSNDSAAGQSNDHNSEDSHQNDSHQNDSHQNDSHESDSHQNDSEPDELGDIGVASVPAAPPKPPPQLSSQDSVSMVTQDYGKNREVYFDASRQLRFDFFYENIYEKASQDHDEGWFQPTKCGRSRCWLRYCRVGTFYRRLWKMILFLGLFRDSWTIALGLMDVLPRDNPTVETLVFDYVIDVVFCLDIFLSRYLFSYIEDGQEITDSATIARHYDQQWFVYDIVAVIPIDLLFLCIDAGKYLYLFPVLRLNRNVRMVHWNSYFKDLDVFLVSRGIQITNAARRILKLFLVLLLLVHYLACCFVVVGQYSQDAGDVNWIDADITHHGGLWGYMRAMYFILVSITTVGYGDIVPLSTEETCFSTAAVLCAGLTYPAVVGAVASLMLNFDAAKTQHKHKISNLRNFLDFKQLPQRLVSKFEGYSQYIWMRQKGVNEKELLGDLPPSLRLKIGMYTSLEIIKKIPFFKDVSTPFLYMIISKLTPRTFCPNDILIRAGDYNNNLYILKHGHVSVLVKSQEDEEEKDEEQKESQPQPPTPALKPQGSKPSQKEESEKQLLPPSPALRSKNSLLSARTAGSSNTGDAKNSGANVSNQAPSSQPVPEVNFVCVCVLQRGALFGETALLPNRLRPVAIASCVCDGFSDTFVLSRSAYLSVLQVYPEWEHNIAVAAHNELIRKDMENRKKKEKEEQLRQRKERIARMQDGPSAHARIDKDLMNDKRDEDDEGPEQFTIDRSGKDSGSLANLRSRRSEDTKEPLPEDEVDEKEPENEKDKDKNSKNNTKDNKDAVDLVAQMNLKDLRKIFLEDSDPFVETENLALAQGLYLPTSRVRRIWSILCGLLLLYNFFVIPFRICLYSNNVTSGWSALDGGILAWFLVEQSLDLVWWVDIYLRCYKFTYSVNGILITDKDTLKSRYLGGARCCNGGNTSTEANSGPGGGFIYDVLAGVPIDFLVLLPIAFEWYKGVVRDCRSSSLGSTEYYAISDCMEFNIVLFWSCLRILKLFKAWRLREYIKALEHFFEEWKALSPESIQLGKWLCLIVLTCHYVACGFIFLAVFIEGSEATTVRNGVYQHGFQPLNHVNGSNLFVGTWIDDQFRQGYLDYGNPVGSYWMRAINWALPTIVVVVIGDVTPVTNTETMYVIFTILLAISFNAVLIGNLANVVGGVLKPESKYLVKLDHIDRYMKAHDIPNALQDRVRSYFEYVWEATRDVDEDIILQDVPSTLRRSVKYWLLRHFVNSVPFFEQCDLVLTKHIVAGCQAMISSPYDAIIRQNEFGQNMYFLEEGIAVVYTGDLVTRQNLVFHNVLRPGAFFGESSCFLRSPRSSTVQALTFCYLHVLSVTHVENVLREHLDGSEENVVKLNMTSIIRTLQKEKLARHHRGKLVHLQKMQRLRERERVEQKRRKRAKRLEKQRKETLELERKNTKLMQDALALNDQEGLPSTFSARDEEVSGEGAGGGEFQQADGGFQHAINGVSGNAREATQPAGVLESSRSDTIADGLAVEEQAPQSAAMSVRYGLEDRGFKGRQGGSSGGRRRRNDSGTYMSTEHETQWLKSMLPRKESHGVEDFVQATQPDIAVPKLRSDNNAHSSDSDSSLLGDGGGDVVSDTDDKDDTHQQDQGHGNTHHIGDGVVAHSVDESRGCDGDAPVQDVGAHTDTGEQDGVRTQVNMSSGVAAPKDNERAIPVRTDNLDTSVDGVARPDVVEHRRSTSASLAPLDTTAESPVPRLTHNIVVTSPGGHVIDTVSGTQVAPERVNVTVADQGVVSQSPPPPNATPSDGATTFSHCIRPSSVIKPLHPASKPLFTYTVADSVVDHDDTNPVGGDTASADAVGGVEGDESVDDGDTSFMHSPVIRTNRIMAWGDAVVQTTTEPTGPVGERGMVGQKDGVEQKDPSESPVFVHSSVPSNHQAVSESPVFVHSARAMLPFNTPTLPLDLMAQIRPHKVASTSTNTRGDESRSRMSFRALSNINNNNNQQASILPGSPSPLVSAATGHASSPTRFTLSLQDAVQQQQQHDAQNAPIDRLYGHNNSAGHNSSTGGAAGAGGAVDPPPPPPVPAVVVEMTEVKGVPDVNSQPGAVGGQHDASTTPSNHKVLTSSNSSTQDAHRRTGEAPELKRTRAFEAGEIDAMDDDLNSIPLQNIKTIHMNRAMLTGNNLALEQLIRAERKHTELLDLYVDKRRKSNNNNSSNNNNDSIDGDYSSAGSSSTVNKPALPREKSVYYLSKSLLPSETDRSLLVNGIYSPHSRLVWGWDVVCIVVSLFYLWSVPFQLAFWIGDNSEIDSVASAYVLGPLVVGYLCDVCMFLDVYFRAFRFGVKRHILSTKILMDEAEIWGNYKSHWMYFHLFALIPYDFLALFVSGSVDAQWIPTVLAWCRVPKLIITLKLPYWSRKLNEYLTQWTRRVDLGRMYILKLVLVALYIMHFFGCTWVMIARFIEGVSGSSWGGLSRDFDAFASNPSPGTAQQGVEVSAITNPTRNPVFFTAMDNSHLTWMDIDNQLHTQSISFQYIRSVYFALTTLSSIGYGDIRPNTDIETAFQLCQVMMGACLFATLIGTFALRFKQLDQLTLARHYRSIHAYSQHISGLLKKFPDSDVGGDVVETNDDDIKHDVESQELARKCRQVDDFLAQQNRRSLRERVLHHFNYMLYVRKGMDREICNFVEELPVALRLDMTLFNNLELLGRTELLRKTQYRYLSRLVYLLKARSYRCGDVVFRFGEHDSRLYFVESGRLARFSLHPSVDNSQDQPALLPFTYQGTYQAGSYFGVTEYQEDSFLRDCIVRATAFSEIKTVRHKDLQLLAKSDPFFRGTDLYRHLSRAHRSASRKKRSVNEWIFHRRTGKMRRGNAGGGGTAGNHGAGTSGDMYAGNAREIGEHSPRPRTASSGQVQSAQPDDIPESAVTTAGDLVVPTGSVTRRRSQSSGMIVSSTAGGGDSSYADNSDNVDKSVGMASSRFSFEEDDSRQEAARSRFDALFKPPARVAEVQSAASTPKAAM